MQKSEPRHNGPIPGPSEDHPQWLADRQYDPDRVEHPVLFGASDAAVACDRSRYATALDLYLKTRGEAVEEERPADVEARLRRGRRMQPVFIGEYADEYKTPVTEPLRSYYHPDKPFMSCTPDGIAMPADSPRYLVECKGTTPHMYAALTAMEDNRYGEQGTDVIPDEVLFQTQQQMDVMDMDKCDVVVFFGLFVMRVYPVQRNDVIIDAITEAESELSQRIMNSDPPEPNWTHPRTRALISELHGLRANTVEQLTTIDLQNWLAYRVAGEEIKELEKTREGLRNELLWHIGSAEIGRLPAGKKELRRVVVADSLVTEADVVKLQARIGQVKRKGHERLTERKVK